MPAPLQSHHLLAVITRPDRGGEVSQRDAHRLGPRLDLELVFPLARPRVVVDVDHPGVLLEPFLAPLDRSLQLLHGVGSGLREQLELDRLAPRADVFSAKDQRLRTGEIPCLPAPFADELLACDIAEFALHQFDRDRPHMAAAHAGIRAHLTQRGHLPDRPMDQFHDRRGSGREILRRHNGCIFESLRGLFRDARRRAVGKDDLRKQPVGVDLWKEQKRRDSAANNPAGQQQNAHGRRHHRKAVVEREIKKRGIHVPDKPLQATVTATLEPGDHGHEQSQRIEHDPEDREHEVLFMCQMARQDEQRLHERHQ